MREAARRAVASLTASARFRTSGREASAGRDGGVHVDGVGHAGDLRVDGERFAGLAAHHQQQGVPGLVETGDGVGQLVLGVGKQLARAQDVQLRHQPGGELGFRRFVQLLPARHARAGDVDEGVLRDELVVGGGRLDGHLTAHDIVLAFDRALAQFGAGQAAPRDRGSEAAQQRLGQQQRRVRVVEAHVAAAIELGICEVEVPTLSRISVPVVSRCVTSTRSAGWRRRSWPNDPKTLGTIFGRNSLRREPKVEVGLRAASAWSRMRSFFASASATACCSVSVADCAVTGPQR